MNLGTKVRLKVNPCLLIRYKFPCMARWGNITITKTRTSIFTGIKGLSWMVKPMDFSWVPILSIYCIYTVQSCLKEPSKTWTYLDYFPVLDSFGCWWDSGLVALEVALLHRHLKALHISAVTRIGALQQQVLGLHLPKQRPHMLRRDILSAQLLDHWITIPLDKYDVPPFKPKTSQNPIGKTHVLPTSPYISLYHLHHISRNSRPINLLVMRPCIVSPADVDTHLLHWNLLQRPVQGLHVASCHVQKLCLGANCENCFIISILFPTYPHCSILFPEFSSGPRPSGGENLEKSIESGLTEIRPLGVAAHAQVGTVHLGASSRSRNFMKSKHLENWQISGKIVLSMCVCVVHR